jgi:heme-degrading monooxygenase HmoA
MILEAVILNIKPGQSTTFETAFAQAAPVITSMEGYLSHELHRCLETEDRYLLLVRWQTLESHTVGFRSSEAYQEWKRRLHHFYDPFPTVEHYTLI